MEWMEETLRIHKKFNLRKETFEKILDQIEFRNGVEEVFREIHSNNIPSCLISGGFKYQADKAQIKLKIKHAFTACEYFWDESGFLNHWNLLPSDERGKVSFMKLLISEYSIDKKQCAFIGDGENDILLADEVGFSIAPW